MRVWNWPVLPVMPCVMTLVFLLIRMACYLIDNGEKVGVTLTRGLSHAAGCRDDLFGRVGHVGGGDDRQARVGEDLLAELDVGAFEPHDQRHLEPHLARRRHHALRRSRRTS